MSDQTFPSTTWQWQKRKIKPARQGQETQQPRRRRGYLRLKPWPRTRSLRLTVTYRGGAESWWFIEARGCAQAFPGHLALEDVMARILSER